MTWTPQVIDGGLSGNSGEASEAFQGAAFALPGRTVPVPYIVHALRENNEAFVPPPAGQGVIPEEFITPDGNIDVEAVIRNIDEREKAAVESRALLRRHSRLYDHFGF